MKQERIRNRFLLLVPGMMGLLSLLPVSPLSAQVTCSGSTCQYLPFVDQLNSMYYEFHQQYAQTLFDDMAEAGATAGIATASGGTVNLQGFSIGLGLNAAYIPAHDVTVNITGVGTFDKVPSAGGAVVPRLFFGVNVGRILGMDYDPDDPANPAPSFISPLRFDVYVSYLSHSETYTNSKMSGTAEASVNMRGAEIRYHLIEPISIIAGPILRFRGVSLGVGMYKNKQTALFTQENSDINLTTVGATQFVWKGTNKFEYSMNIDTYPIDLRTGIQFLYLFNLSLGGGVIVAKGESKFALSRVGPVVATGDPLAAIDWNLPPEMNIPGLTPEQMAELMAAATGTWSSSPILAMKIEGKGRVPKEIPYGRAGLELNLWAVKVSLDAVMTKRAYAANVGLRFEI